MSAALPISERELQETLVEAAKLTGWRVYHTFDSRRSAPGFPDLVLCHPPVLLFRELKTETGNLKPAQAAWLDALARVTLVEAGVWRPSDLDEVLATLRREGRGQ